MTIKEIARLAGVSTSTVSKIVNGKTSSISAETTEKVLKIVKEYNYSPYAFVKNNGSRSYLIGLVLNESDFSFTLANAFAEASLKSGYHVIPIFLKNTQDDVFSESASLAAMNVDALVTDCSADFEEFTKKDIPVYSLNEQFGLNAIIKMAAEKGREVFSNRNHKKTTAVFSSMKPASKLCFNSILSLNAFIDNITFHDFTAAFCVDFETAVKLHQALSERAMQVPRDLSLIAFSTSYNAELLSFDTIIFDIRKYAKDILTAVVNNIERGELRFIFKDYYEYLDKATVSYPNYNEKVNISVFGFLNSDIFMDLTTFPEVGRTVIASSKEVFTGGKGANQAVAAARLGARVRFFGCLGNDEEGKRIYKQMAAELESVEDLQIDSSLPTGNATIYSDFQGDSSIVVYPGANEAFDVSKLRGVSFEGVKYCLLQTELEAQKVEEINNIVSAWKVKIMLKTCSSSISTESLSKVDYVVPNRKELAYLVKEGSTIEEKAHWLRTNGVKNVIVTLDKDGCYVDSEEGCFYCSPYDVEVIDTTGGADAFIGALAVFLGEGSALRSAVVKANIAAGFSLCHKGVVPSLVNRQELDRIYLKSNKLPVIKEAANG